jgi:hypothetical protein
MHAEVPTRNSFRLGLLSVASIALLSIGLRTWTCSHCGAMMWAQERTGARGEEEARVLHSSDS